MKKKSRFLTGLLSAVMALSLFALPASAAGNDDIVSTINTDTKGSLTINKYEGEKDDTSKPLNGVEFTLYKVADIVQTTTVPIEVSMVPVTELTEAAERLNTTITIDKDTTYNTIANVVNEALKGDENGENKLVVAGTQTTQTTTINGESKDGVAQFKDLAVGVYLVVETDAPPQIVNHSANFLVSIPMMNSDGKTWNYNIVANPKNTAYYAGITLKKYGKEGNGSETALSGAEFVLQKYNETSGDWKTLTKADNDNLTENGTLITSNEEGKVGQIHVDGLQPGKYRFIEVSAPDDSGYITDGETAYAFEIKIDEKGKTTYVIDKAYKEGDADAIKVVNEKPDLTKQVKKGDSYSKDADFSVGDTVTWKVETTVPSKVNKLATFEIVDQMSTALDFDQKTANMTVVTDKEGVTLDSKGEKPDYDLKVTPATKDSGSKWTITFTQNGKDKLAKNGITKITVTFDTVLNKNAVATTGGNLNKAQLNYTNAFYPNQENGKDYPEHPTPETDVVKDESIVYTFGMNIVKVDGKTNSSLGGAEFDLYKYKGTAPDNVTEADLKNTENATLVRSGLVSDNENGQLSDKKTGNPLYFSNGDYFLVETKAPTDAEGNNYNLLKEPVKVKLNVVYVTKTTTTTTKEVNTDNTFTVKKTTVTETTFNNSEDANAGTINITVKNNKGFDLPVTGGFGTLLFSCIGALLVVGGVGVLMSTKKKKKGNA